MESPIRRALFIFFLVYLREINRGWARLGSAGLGSAGLVTAELSWDWLGWARLD